VLPVPELVEPWDEAAYAVHSPKAFAPTGVGPAVCGCPACSSADPVAWGEACPFGLGTEMPTSESVVDTLDWIGVGRTPAAAAAVPPPKTRAAATAAAFSVSRFASIGRLLVRVNSPTPVGTRTAAATAATSWLSAASSPAVAGALADRTSMATFWKPGGASLGAILPSKIASAVLWSSGFTRISPVTSSGALITSRIPVAQAFSSVAVPDAGAFGLLPGYVR
jgi:hypothetical protein